MTLSAKERLEIACRGRLLPILNRRMQTDYYCMRQEEIHKKFSEYFIDGSPTILLDSDQHSLQWRILKYLKKKKLLKTPGAQLKEAWLSAKAANAAEQRKAILGEHKTEKTLGDLRSDFTPMEQWLCHQASIGGEFTEPFTLKDFIDLVERTFFEGKGPRLLRFISLLNGNYTRRGKGFKFNAQTVVCSLAWVSPFLPLWMLPSQAISVFLMMILEVESEPTTASINSAIRTGGLLRLPDEILRKFYRSKIDGEGEALHFEISELLGFDIKRCFRGRHPES